MPATSRKAIRYCCRCSRAGDATQVAQPATREKWRFDSRITRRAQDWPDGAERYVASHYDTHVETWDRVRHSCSSPDNAFATKCCEKRTSIVESYSATRGLRPALNDDRSSPLIVDADCDRSSVVNFHERVIPTQYVTSSNRRCFLSYRRSHEIR